MNRNVFLSLLALDSYNRGYDQSLFPLTVGRDVGDAKFLTDSIQELGTDAEAAGFYAIAYEWNGEKIISYRGTSFNNGFDDTTKTDALNGWVVGIGDYDASQADQPFSYPAQMTHGRAHARRTAPRHPR